MADELQVRAGALAVGRLTAGEGGVRSFRYDASWLEDEAAFPVSLSLPMQADEHRGDAARFFFGNLLPEGATREAICGRLGISSENDWALLRAIGGECAGALSVVPPGEAPPDPAQYRYEPLSDKALQALVSDVDAVPLLLGGPPTRLSLAGAQSKLPVTVREGKLYLPSAGAPSTHILKLPNERFPHLTTNEAFVMGLAARIGLPVARAQLLVVTTPPSLLVERFDRRSDQHGPPFRLHQEDLCQALGLHRSSKYEQEGGPTLARAIALVRAHVDDPLDAVRRLIQWQAFNVAAGNADSHGKNLALLYESAGRLRLAPFYDLLCTRIYPRHVRLLAMSVGGAQNPDAITRAHWEGLAAELGIGARVVIDIVRTLAEECLAAIAGQTDEHAERYGKQTLQGIPTLVRKSARRLAAALRPHA
jgi:serine/threonine-protein kinase HipA